jgi:hypothetical protein
VFCIADSSIWGVRHFNGISTLVRIPPPYDRWNQIYSWPYGKDIYDIDISPNGKYLSGALAEASGRQSLIMMRTDGLIAGDTSYATIFDFGNSNPANFIFSEDARYLFGSSYYSGVSNIYRYDIEADSMEAVTNCEAGFFRPIPISDDSIIVMNYTGKGFVPAIIPNLTIEDISAIKFLGQEIVKKHPMVKDWVLSSPATIDPDTIPADSGRYHPLKYIGLASGYPIVEGYKHYTSVGMRFNLSSPIGLHRASLSTTYTPSKGIPDDEKWHGKFSYHHLGWTINARYNAAEFYDLFGPTKSSRKGYSLGINFRKTLLFDEPKTIHYTLSATGYGGLKRMPDYQNVSTSYDKFYTFSGEMTFRNLRTSLGAVDYEKGFRLQIVSGNTLVNKKLYPRVYSNFDYGIPLPISHLSLWLRGSAGHSFGEREEPFANFFFGGFGNNWVDNSSIKRYRSYYSFPGVELNDIGGINFGKIIAELSLPPLRFRRLGFPAFYCTWIRPAIFASGIMTNVDNDFYRRKVYNIGGQVDIRLQLLSHNKLTVSFGYAAAFEDSRNISDEFMVSLKVL